MVVLSRSLWWPWQVAAKLQLKKRQKKEEEQRLKLELKEIATRRQFLAANAEQALCARRPRGLAVRLGGGEGACGAAGGAGPGGLEAAEGESH